MANIRLTTFLNAVSAIGNGQLHRVEEAAGMVVEISGTFVATITFEASMDAAGSTWTAITAVNLADGSKATTATVPGLYYITGTGIDAVRTRVSAYTSGAITAKGRKTNAPITITSTLAAPGAPGVPSVNTEGTKATFSAAITGLAIAAAATDFFTIIGSATKTVRVTRIEISGVATAAGATSVQVLKRSAADTGGTSTAPTVVPHDSGDAGTAVVAAYTANPGALGTLVGLLRSIRPTFTTAAGAIPEVPVALDFTLRSEKGVVLRGVAQSLALGLNGATVAGLTVDIGITWTEE